MDTKKIKGELEIDSERGAIYFHSEKTGTTVLRMQGLPAPIKLDRIILDMNFSLRPVATISW